MSAQGANGTGTHEAPHAPVFVGEPRAALERLFGDYPTKQACLLPALWMVQEARGWISEPAIEEVAGVLDLTPAYVKGVVTFYTMY
ncbi:MAG: NAD(P)H-dependent oxidoreductase subunit E, partial [Gemmatimonadales bacterium]